MMCQKDKAKGIVKSQAAFPFCLFKSDFIKYPESLTAPFLKQKPHVFQIKNQFYIQNSLMRMILLLLYLLLLSPLR